MTISKIIFRSALFTLLVGCIATSASAAESKKKKQPTKQAQEAGVMTVEGEVVAVFDDDYNLTGVRLLTFDGDTYHIKLDDKGKKLAVLDGMDVAVTGSLNKKLGKKKGEKWLVLRSYEELSWY